MLIKCVTRKGFSRTQSYFFELLRFSSLKYSLSLDKIENLKINNQEDYVKRNANKSTFIVSSKIKSFDKFDRLLKIYSVILTFTSNSNTQIDRNMFGDWQNVHWISNEFGINGRFLWLLLLLSPDLVFRFRSFMAKQRNMAWNWNSCNGINAYINHRHNSFRKPFFRTETNVNIYRENKMHCCCFHWKVLKKMSR